MSWQSVLKSFITGSARSPLPELDSLALGLPLSSDPAQTALEALVAASLLQKAAFPLRSISRADLPVPASGSAASVCSDAAAQDLKRMLSGRYVQALSEFVTLAVQQNILLPPEMLPALLEKVERDVHFAEIIRPALGPRGEWLARQNPHWRPILAESPTDWFTATFSERKLLFAATRARNPLLALAWLEKTWPEEKAEHKVQFLDLMQIRPSLADEDLLEKAFSDKNRDVRRAAAQVLATLPESRIFSAAKKFFKERLAGALLAESKTETEARLKKFLPDLAEENIARWIALLTKEELNDWRAALLRLFVRLLPPAELANATGLEQGKLVARLDDVKDAAALLEATVRHKDGSWAEAILGYFTRDFRHTVWQSPEMLAFLTHFAPEMMSFLQKNKFTLGYDNQVVLRALENYRRPWPKSMLEHFLEQYRRPAYGNGEIPGWHCTAALQTAAYHCVPSDAANSALTRDYIQNPPKARPREFEEFLGIIRFRLKMYEHLKG